MFFCKNVEMMFDFGVTFLKIKSFKPTKAAGILSRIFGQYTLRGRFRIK